MDNHQTMKPCVFFDRDGIVNVSPGPGYVEAVDAFDLNSAIVDALRCVREKGYLSILITNQRGVGRGIMTQETLDAIHAHMEGLLAKQGEGFTDIYFCTDTDDSSPMRKPNPGMILDAVERHHLDVAASWMIGDNESDVTAGVRAGCRTIRVAPLEVDSAATRRIAEIEELPALLKAIL